MADDPANCVDIDFPMSRCTRLCNVAKHVLIVFPANDDRPFEVRFNVKTDLLYPNVKGNPSGDYNCQSSLPAIADHFKTSVKPQLAKVMGWDANKIPLMMSCQKEDCFDTRDGYWLGKPWKEPKSCDLLGGNGKRGVWWARRRMNG